jgi:hypothetical protein
MRRISPDTGRRLMALSVAQLRRRRSQRLVADRFGEDGHAA